MHAAGVREIGCKGDCMQMWAVSSIRAQRFHLEKGYVRTTVPLGYTPLPRAFLCAGLFQPRRANARREWFV